MNHQGANQTHTLATRNIPSLDGLRAVSILVVILAHSSWYFPEWIRQSLFFRYVIGNGAHGVAVFFVISGYLITTLLLREFDKSGTISLRRFFFRRSLRIFPPFYVFLLVMSVLWFVRIVPEHAPSFFAAWTYTLAYYPGAQGYYIFHSWSLSVEEQFYLLWPLLFVVWPCRPKLVRVSVLLIVAMPAVRTLLYFVAPGLRGHEGYMVQGWIDTIMVGCLLALLRRHPAWEVGCRRHLTGWTAASMAATAFFVTPWIADALPKKMAGLFGLLISPSLKALCIGGVLIYLVENKNCLLGGFLNSRVVRHIGVISYSLYLWQQVFTSPEFPVLPYGYLYALGAAEFSYWLVERPALKLRGRLERSSLNLREGRTERGTA